MRRLGILAALVAIVATASACNVTPPAASVDGTQISEGTFHSELNDVASNSNVRCALGLLTGQTFAKNGAGTNTVPTKFADAELTELIDNALYTQELNRLKTPVDAAFTTYAKSALPDYLSPASGQSPCGTDGSALVAQLPGWFVNQQVNLLADELALVSKLGKVDIGPAGVQAFYDNNQSDFVVLSLEVLATKTEAEAKADEEEIAGGKSFASVAESSSINSSLAQEGFSPDGSYPEVSAPQLVQDEPNWAAALDSINFKDGVPTAPVNDDSTVDQGGTGDWLVIELLNRSVQPLTASISLQIQEYLIGQNANVFSAEQAKLLNAAHVTVDPEYGTWSALKSGVLPSVTEPLAPKSQYLLNSSADSSSS